MKPLAGKRILLVETDYYVGMDLARMMADLGAEVVGPVESLEKARSLVEQETVDGAILDVHLDGHSSLPLADALSDAGLPIILSVGRDDTPLPERFRETPTLTKPFDETSLRRVTVAAFCAK